MKKTTVKAISLAYRAVGGSGDYTPFMGVLKGLAINQDTPDSTEIEAEFYDAPFDIFYQGKPVTMTFELANYDLADLPAIFGGSYDATHDVYDGATTAYTSEKEWKLNFGRGNASLIIARGLTVGTLKKDADGALNYSVTITALVYTDNSTHPATDVMYKIVGNAAGGSTFAAVLTSISGYSEKNPQNEGWYERTGTEGNYQYRLTWDAAVVEGKTYYTKD